MSIFDAASFRRFVTDIRHGHDDLIVPAADVIDLQSYVEETEAWLRDLTPVIAADFALDDPNPLADGHYCPTCGIRLDKADRPCPFAPHEETR